MFNRVWKRFACGTNEIQFSVLPITHRFALVLRACSSSSSSFLFRPGDKAYDREKSLAGSQAKVEVKEVEQLLESLERRRPFTGRDTILFRADYYCALFDRETLLRFCQSSDEWFRQAYPHFSNKIFKVTSSLCNLGKANASSNGLLIKRLGWKPIDFLASRMTQIGIGRFHAEDVASAITGFHNLLAYSDKNLRRRWRPSAEWMNAFSEYLRQKRPEDADWKPVIRDTAPLSLWFLRQMNVQPERKLLEVLCRMSTLGFDGIVADDAEIRSRDLYSLTPVFFAESWFAWNLDPESLCPGAWSSWYKVYFATLDCRKPLLENLSYPLEVGGRFHCDTRIFWQNFERYSEVLRRTVDDPQYIGTYDSVSKLLFNLSTFVKRRLRERPDSADDIRKHLPLLESLLVVERPREPASSIICQMRILTAFRDLNRILKCEFRLSKNFYLRLLDWCSSNMRSQLRNPSENVGHAATIMFLLSELNPPDFLLDELSRIFYASMGKMSSEQWLRIMAMFGDSCIRLDYVPQPTAMDGSSQVRTDPWHVFFVNANRYLQQYWPESFNPMLIRNAEHFLRILPHLAIKHNLWNEFLILHDAYVSRFNQLIKGNFNDLCPRNSHTVLGYLHKLKVSDNKLTFEQLRLDLLQQKADVFTKDKPLQMMSETANNLATV